jgi:enoyl-CoA hydratase
MPITVERQRHIATVRLHHGAVNALDTELCQQIAETFTELGAEDGVRAIVLTGNGRAFSAGVDLTAVLAGGRDEVHTFLGALADSFRAVFTCPTPTVAAVDGHAIAGGCVLAAACDRVLAADSSLRMGLSELRVGVPFPTTAIEIVRHRAGHHLATLVLEANTFPPDAAARFGLVDHVVPAMDLTTRATELAEILAGVPTETYRLAKEQLQTPARAAIAAHEDDWDGRMRAGWDSEDVRAAIDRFMDSLRG